MKTVTYDETKFVIVPREPTPEMNYAAYDTDEISFESGDNIDEQIHECFPKIYKAMLSAAQKQEG